MFINKNSCGHYLLWPARNDGLSPNCLSSIALLSKVNLFSCFFDYFSIILAIAETIQDEYIIIILYRHNLWRLC